MDASLSTTICWVLLQRKDMDHLHISGSISYMCSFCSSLVWETVESFSEVHHKHITLLPIFIPLSMSSVNSIGFLLRVWM